MVPIALFTGAGQLLSIFALKYLSLHDGTGQLKAIGETDSLIQFIINIIALGLQSVSMRNLALMSEWKEEYRLGQVARITLGTLLMSVTALAFLNKYYALFLIAPLLALNGDYALYGLGHPVKGAIIAFMRLLIPYSVLILMTRFDQSLLVEAYIASVIIIYLLTNLYISYYLQTPWLYLPRLKSLKLYLYSLPLGIVTLSLYFLGLGLLLVIPYFYDDAVVAVVFVGLKFYTIYKGVLRIIHQAFLKDMIQDNTRLRIDQMSILLALFFGGSVLIYPQSFIKLFLGGKYLDQQVFFSFIGLAALICSIFPSLGTKAILFKKDKPYAVVSVTSAATAILSSILLAFLHAGLVGPGIGLCLGEIVLLAGVTKISGTVPEIRSRVIFLLQTLPGLILPVVLRYFFQDGYITYFFAFGIFGLLMVVLHFQKFRSFFAV
jgi:hypothetical protein